MNVLENNKSRLYDAGHHTTLRIKQTSARQKRTDKNYFYKSVHVNINRKKLFINSPYAVSVAALKIRLDVVQRPTR